MVSAHTELDCRQAYWHLSELNAALGNIDFPFDQAEIAVSLPAGYGGPLAGSAPSRFTARYRPHQSAHQDRSVAGHFKSDGVDIAIRFGTGDWKGLRRSSFSMKSFPVWPEPQRRTIAKTCIDVVGERRLIDRNVSWHTPTFRLFR